MKSGKSSEFRFVSTVQAIGDSICGVENTFNNIIGEQVDMFLEVSCEHVVSAVGIVFLLPEEIEDDVYLIGGI